MPVCFKNCFSGAGTLLKEKKNPYYVPFYWKPVTGLLSEAHSAVEGVMLRCTSARRVAPQLAEKTNPV